MVLPLFNFPGADPLVRSEIFFCICAVAGAAYLFTRPKTDPPAPFRRRCILGANFDRAEIEPIQYYIGLFYPMKIVAIEEATYAPSGGLIVWSKHSAPLIAKILELTDGEKLRTEFAVLPIDDTPLPPSLAVHPVFNYLGPADVAWQWRVQFMGVPADLVERPGRHS